MKTAIVYALVSSPDDIYLEQAFVSMFSAKRHNPDCRVVLCVDETTNASFVGDRKRLLRYADEVVVVPGIDPTLPAKVRSRLVKTSTRQMVEGPMLAIDVDTIIVKPLDAIDSLTDEIMACRDSHSPFATSPYRRLCVDHGHELGWDIESEETYFNSGVVFTLDTPTAHDFYARWQQKYIEFWHKTAGMDQPAFALINNLTGHPVKQIPDVYNVQFKHGLRYLPDAKIVHYLTTNSFGRQPFLLNEMAVMERVKLSGSVPDDVVAAIDNPFCGIPEVSFMVSIDMLQDIMYPASPSVSRLLRRRIRKILQWPLRATGLYDFIKRKRKRRT